jgi:hypothetical protein
MTGKINVLQEKKNETKVLQVYIYRNMIVYYEKEIY